jgi:hypothetical protein
MPPNGMSESSGPPVTIGGLLVERLKLCGWCDVEPEGPPYDFLALELPYCEAGVMKYRLKNTLSAGAEAQITESWASRVVQIQP